MVSPAVSRTLRLMAGIPDEDQPDFSGPRPFDPTSMPDSQPAMEGSAAIYDARDADSGPREATPGSVGSQPLPQTAYADPTVSDPAYTQSSSGMTYGPYDTSGPAEGPPTLGDVTMQNGGEPTGNGDYIEMPIRPMEAQQPEAPRFEEASMPDIGAGLKPVWDAAGRVVGYVQEAVNNVVQQAQSNMAQNRRNAEDANRATGYGQVSSTPGEPDYVPPTTSPLTWATNTVGEAISTFAPPMGGAPQQMDRMEAIERQAAEWLGVDGSGARGIAVRKRAVEDPRWRAAQPALAAEYDDLQRDFGLNVMGQVGDAAKFDNAAQVAGRAASQGATRAAGQEAVNAAADGGPGIGRALADSGGGFAESASRGSVREAPAAPPSWSFPEGVTDIRTPISAGLASGYGPDDIRAFYVARRWPDEWTANPELVPPTREGFPPYTREQAVKIAEQEFARDLKREPEAVRALLNTPPADPGRTLGTAGVAPSARIATDIGNSLAGGMAGAVYSEATGDRENMGRNVLAGMVGAPILGRGMRRAGGAMGTMGVGPNGRPSKPTVEVLQQELDGMRSLIQRARASGDAALEKRAIDRAWQLESELVDARNARLDLEPRIASDVGRRFDNEPNSQMTAEDRWSVGRERVSPQDAADLTQPSAVATDMRGRMNSAVPFDPASALAGGVAGASDTDEEGNPDPLKTAAGVFVAGLGNSRYGRRFLSNAARHAQQGPPPNLWEMLQGTRFSWGMLGNFSTGLVNAAGAPVEIAMGIPTEALRMGVMRGRPLGVVNEAVELAGGLRDGARQLLATALGEIPPSVRNAPDFRPPLAERMAGTMGRVGNVDTGAVVGEAIDLPGRLTSQAPDAFWRPVLLQWGRAREAANIVAENGVSKLDPAAQWRELQRLKNNPTPAESQRMTDAAQKWADEMGYKGDEGYWEGSAKGLFRPRGRITTSADPMAQQVHEALGSFVMPFIGSVWKLHKLAATRVPGAGFIANRSLPVDEKLSRQLIGGATIYLLADYAAQGMITGPGPADPDEAAIVNKRMPKNSTYVPGVGWVPNDTFGSAGPYLNAIGGYYDSRRYQTDKEKATPGKDDESAVKYVLRGFERFPVAQAAQSVIAMVESPIKGASDMLANVASSFAPAPYRSYQASQDPYARTVDRDAGLDRGGATALAEQTRQKIISRVGYVPGLGAREDLQPALDRFGRPVENDRQGAAAFLPRVSNPKPDPLADAFARAGIEPGMPPAEIDNIPLTTEQKREWQRVRGEALATKTDLLARAAEYPEARRKTVFDAQMSLASDRAGQAVRRLITQEQRAKARKKAS